MLNNPIQFSCLNTENTRLIKLKILTHSRVYFSSAPLNLMFCRATTKADPSTYILIISFWAVSQSMARLSAIKAHLEIGGQNYSQMLTTVNFPS